jgi:hypothetical protein
MPKKVEYVTKQELSQELSTLRKDITRDMDKLQLNILSEVRVMFKEFAKVMNDNFKLIHKELINIKLVQVEHEDRLDVHQHNIADLQKDVSLLRTLDTI